jgi:hypothetical protein
MMILAFLVLTSIHTITQASEIVSATKPSQIAESCKEFRTIFDIIWPCFITMFACAWTAVHPNIPGPDEGKLSILWTRMKLVMLTLVAPEVTLFWALEQRRRAKEVVATAKQQGERTV